MKLGVNDLMHAYRMMKTIREFEERVHLEFAKGEIPGFVHLYAGEEACAVGICMHLSEEDYITSTHRGHGHCIAKGVDVEGMMAELFGRSTGVCHGKGGSMHIADLDLGMMGANGIVGGGPPLACGAALAAQRQGRDRVAVAFVGDGGSNQGTTLESLNLAKIWNLPVIFVIEDNGYAESTSSTYSIAAESNAVRARGFGLPASSVDGHDFFAVYEAAEEAISRARRGEGPTLLDCHVKRYYGHYEGDAQRYRKSNEALLLRETRDCLSNFKERCVRVWNIDTSAFNEIDLEIAELIDRSVSAATGAPFPDSEALLTDVYVSY